MLARLRLMRVAVVQLCCVLWLCAGVLPGAHGDSQAAASPSAAPFPTYPWVRNVHLVFMVLFAPPPGHLGAFCLARG
jgi:hypothetical protein